MGAGVAWLDANGDGRLDLYVMQSGAFPPDGGEAAKNVLFLQTAEATFEAAPASDAADRSYGQGVTAADYDGDGDIDLYLCNFGPDRLLRNRGDGHFDDVSELAGLGLDGWSSSAAFADADQDGDLDLYVTRYLEYDIDHEFFCGDPNDGSRRYCDPTLFAGAEDRFFLNLGDGRFLDATTEAGLAGANGKGLGVLFADFDNDGAPDLYVANDLTANGYYRNRGDGTFESLSLLSGAAFNADGKAEAGMGLALGDWDFDDDLDLAVSNFDVETNTLYRNEGASLFEDRSAASGFGPPSFNLLGFGALLADLNMDGYLDYYVTNGHIFEQPLRKDIGWRQRDLLLLGDSTGSFVERRCGSAFGQEEVGRGLAAADYDRDGDLDIAITNNGGPLQLLRNDGAGVAAVRLELFGADLNSRAIGASVSLRLDVGSRRFALTAGDSYQSSSDSALLLSWPDSRSPRELLVRWPNGEEQKVDASAIERGASYIVRQGQQRLQTVGVVDSDQSVGRIRAATYFGFGALVILLVILIARSVRGKGGDHT
jgi:hypothetical protein